MTYLIRDKLVCISSEKCIQEKIKSEISQVLNKHINGHSSGKCLCSELYENIHSPLELSKILLKAFPGIINNVIINGPFEERIIVIELLGTSSCIILTLNSSINDHSFIRKYSDQLILKDSTGIVTLAHIPPPLLKKLIYPNIKLIALYHPENFPLPRFALGISDIARAVRENFMGQVTLKDMQLGVTLEEILNDLRLDKPHIIGISATFGQQDILEDLLSRIGQIKDYHPLIVVGGSLAVLNADYLLTSYPLIMIGLKAGETTIPDIVKYWHKEIPLGEVSDLKFIDEKNNIHKSQVSRTAPLTAGIPELDILETTLQHRGVMQLESTRGCSYACSFCPRAHKGIWSPQSINLIEKLLPEISYIYSSKYPHIAKKIFLVDEEFIGYKEEEETSDRILSVCNTLKKYSFTFETSARVDQVYRRNRDKSWHVERIKLWKYLVKNGLDRALFGVESGVDSILDRFNKKTRKYQNEYAIRILSSFNIPVRLTYITFDPLMSMEELIESFYFQGRKDLLLKPNLSLTVEELFDAIHDEEYVSNNMQDQGLYREISYLLVSMECLIGSKYLANVEKAGLAREYNFSMGRRNAEYLDKRIGMMSHYSQLWVDRNFPLDYTIKSIEKISPREARDHIRGLRAVMKDYAYWLLAKFLAIVTKDLKLLPSDLLNENKNIMSLISEWDYSLKDTLNNQRIFEKVMNDHFSLLIHEFQIRYELIKNYLPIEDQEKVEDVFLNSKSQITWKLINAA